MKKMLFYFCILITGISQAQQEIIDSLILVLKKQIEDTNRVNILNDLSKQIMFQGKYEQSLNYSQEALLLSKKINYSKGIARAYSNKGLIDWNKGDFKEALNYFSKSLSISKEIGDKKGISVAYNNTGLVYLYQGENKEALDNFYKSLKIKEELNDKQGIGIAYLNIGNIYLNQKENLKALDYFSKSLAINIELGDKKYEATNLNNIGIVNGILNDFPKAIEYYLKALEIYKILDNKKGLAMCYSNIGNTYQELDQYKKAMENLLYSVELYKQIDDKQGIGISYTNIGNIYKKEKKFEEALGYFNQSLDILKIVGYKVGIRDVYNSLADLYKQKKDFKKALEFQQLFVEMKDSLLNQESNKQIAEMNTKYESEKKEKDIQLLTKDKKLQVAEIGKQKLIKNLFIIGFVVAILVAFIVLRLFKATKKQKLIIEHQNRQIVESINYSKRIQNSLLPSVAYIKETIPSLFILYEPKNIVSGDFYYFKQFENYSILACVDCTGHGVPGGFMSTLGSLLLDKIVNDTTLKPSEILIQLNNEIIRILHQQAGGELQDGMDLSVCLIDKKNSSIEFSGARNGIIIVTNNEAKRYKANPLPVGGNYIKKGVPIERNFKTESIALNNTDWVFMYTDGFIEQIGGKENEPMNYEQFEKHLINTTRLNTDEEKIALLQSEFTKWSGNNEQTDDVLIIGFNLTKHDNVL
jgi:tetratricopeptide (TPR) repeat protein